MPIYHPQVILTATRVINYKSPIKISPKPLWCMIIRAVPHTLTQILLLPILPCCKIPNCQEMITKIYTTKKVNTTNLCLIQLHAISRGQCIYRDLLYLLYLTDYIMLMSLLYNLPDTSINNLFTFSFLFKLAFVESNTLISHHILYKLTA